MSKLKPNKGLLKRVKITGKGKLKFPRVGKSHLNSEMSGKRNRQLRGKRLIKAPDIKRCEKMLHMNLTPG